MNASFLHRPVNGPFEDPVIYIRLLRQKRAFLFDAGDIGNLSQRELNRISDLFITHTHIDHFIGFDSILRVVLRRDSPLRIYGGEGIRENIEGKLRGYTWNVIQDYPCRLVVHEITRESVSITEYTARNGFSGGEERKTPFNGVVLEGPGYRIRAGFFHHGIPVLGYALEEDYHLNINKVRLLERGLNVGEWLNRLKEAYRRGERSGEFIIDGRPHRLESLIDLLIISKGTKITYLTDIAPTEENIRNAVSFARGSDTLYIETYFLEVDKERALERNHLTAALAGRIGRLAGVRELVPLHFSPKYISLPERVIEEAMAHFTV